MISRSKHPAIATFACLLFGVVVALTAFRTVAQYQTPGTSTPSFQGMCDFHNGIFFPTKALLAGTSPYGERYAAEYPVSRQIPFFSPIILVLHAPLTLLPLPVADVLFFAISVLLVIACATLCAATAGVGGRLEWIASIAAAIALSRSGHITLFNGYFTIELALASIAAIHYAKSRPILAAIALTILSAKPTFILPIGFLLLARGNYKAIVVGAIISLLAAGLPMAWLAYHEGIRATGAVDMPAGVNKIVDDIRGAQEVHMNTPFESPVESWTRLDALATVSKWTGGEPGQVTHLIAMALILAWPMMILFRGSRRELDDGVAGGTGCLIVLAMLTSLYHQSYDAMIVVAPATGLAVTNIEFWKTISFPTRCLIGFLTVFPAFNYLSTRSMLSFLDFGETGFRVVTSLNGVALAVALVMICIEMTRRVKLSS